MDSITPSINDKQRGVEVLSKVFKVLDECQSRKIKLQLYATISKENVNQLDLLATFAKQHGTRVHLKEISSGGRLGYNHKLLLSSSEREILKNFRDEGGAFDEKCWADGESLFMSSTGDLYACNEIFVRQPHLNIGNIKSFVFGRGFASKKISDYNCCYGASASKKAVILFNTDKKCGLLDNVNAPIRTIEDLYKELDDCYANIKNYCFQCREPDCLGYVWLLKSESRRLYQANVPLVKINDGPTFIHSFPINDAGNPDVSVKYPKCSQVDCSGRVCLIRKKRPLVCRLYPVGLETLEDGTAAWVVHLDCLFIKKMDEQAVLNEFEKKFLSILKKISQSLLDEIIATYKEVNAISLFPNGSNNFKVLKGGV